MSEQDNSTTAVAVRNAHGQFVRGVSGNPNGKPIGTKSQITKLRENTELALRDYLADSAQQVKAMKAIDRIMDIALNGDEKVAVGAFKVLFDRLLPNAKQADESADTGHRVPMILQIVNTTAGEKRRPVEVIEGIFDEVEAK